MPSEQSRAAAEGVVKTLYRAVPELFYRVSTHQLSVICMLTINFAQELAERLFDCRGPVFMDLFEIKLKRMCLLRSMDTKLQSVYVLIRYILLRTYTQHSRIPPAFGIGPPVIQVPVHPVFACISFKISAMVAGRASMFLLIR